MNLFKRLINIHNYNYLNSWRKFILIIASIVLVGIFFYPSVKITYKLFLNNYLTFIYQSTEIFCQLIKLDYNLINQDSIAHYISRFFLKVIVSILFFWICKTKVKEKFLFTGLTLILTYILNIFQVLGYVFINEPEFTLLQSRSITNSTSNLSLFFLVSFFVYRNKESIYLYFKGYVTFIQFKKVLYNLFFIISISIVVLMFTIEYFSFKFFAYILVFFTAKFLGLLGFSYEIIGTSIYGLNGGIDIWKECLGLNILIEFIIFVYITGIKIIPKINFIIIGFFLINIFNIVRISIVFIHLQLYNNLTLSNHVHDYLKLPFRSLVLVLWIIWLYRYSDIWPYLKKNKQVN